MSEEDDVKIGLISDTHGLLRPEAAEALRGSALILHAGDIGRSDLIGELEQIAPVQAIRGNIDRESWALRYPETRVVEIAGTRILMLHDVSTLAIDPAAEGIGVVISGHSHRPSIEHRDGVLYLNPGSAGRRRFSLPISVARIDAGATGIEAAIIYLDV
jgi:putative phosphoesterase